MTREEAIDMVKHILKMMPKEPPTECDYVEEWFYEDNKIKKALNMAIKALEQELNTWSLDDAREDFMHDVYNILDFLPTNDEANRIIDSFDMVTKCIKQESRWIPIDKKRPSGFEKVLVTYRLHCDDSIHVGFGGIECNLFNGKYHWNINEQVIGWHVLAWMPLPQPYKEDKE